MMWIKWQRQERGEDADGYDVNGDEMEDMNAE